MKGFTLLETTIVIGILGALSLMSMLTITSFQKDALLDSTAREFAASLRTARNKSVAGEINPAITYDPNDPESLPKYGVKISGNTYTIYNSYKPDGGAAITQDLDSFDLDSNLSLTADGDGEVLFERLNGKTDSEEFTLSDGSNSIKVRVDGNGGVTVIK